MIDFLHIFRRKKPAVRETSPDFFSDLSEEEARAMLGVMDTLPFRYVFEHLMPGDLARERERFEHQEEPSQLVVGKHLGACKVLRELPNKVKTLKQQLENFLEEQEKKREEKNG